MYVGQEVRYETRIMDHGGRARPFRAASTALGDQLIMKDGKEYSGKLVRADANVVEFRIQGKVESFNISDVAQIVFKTPEIVSPPTGRSVSTPTPASIRVFLVPESPGRARTPVVPAQGAREPAPSHRHTSCRDADHDPMAEDVDTERNQAVTSSRNPGRTSDARRPVIARPGRNQRRRPPTREIRAHLPVSPN